MSCKEESKLVKRKVNSGQDTTNELYYTGPSDSKDTVRSFLSKQFKIKPLLSGSLKLDNDYSAFYVNLSEEVPRNSKWLKDFNNTFWKECPELKRKGGFSY